MDSDDERAAEGLSEDLCEAVETGDLVPVVRLINQGADVNHVWGAGKHASRDTDDRLANKHAGLTPAMIAALYGRHHALYPLAAAGADLAAGDDFGRTPLHYAAGLEGHPAATDIARTLIEHGADVNAVDGAGHTPLLWAVSHRQLDTARFLLENGASVRAGEDLPTPATSTTSPIIECVHVAYLLREDPTFDVSTDDVTNMLALLLEEGGCDVNQQDGEDGNTALHWACVFGLVDLSRFLIAKGARVDVANREGKTAAELADSDDMRSCFLTTSSA